MGFIGWLLMAFAAYMYKCLRNTDAYDRKWIQIEKEERANGLIKVFNDQTKTTQPNQKTLVLIPGMWNNPSVFADVAIVLAGMGYRIVIYSMPVILLGPKYDKWTFGTIAEELYRALIEKGVLTEGGKEKIILIDTYVGFIATHFALAHADRLEKMVITNPVMKIPDLPKPVQLVLAVITKLGEFSPQMAHSIFVVLYIRKIIKPGEPVHLRHWFTKEAFSAHYYSVMRRRELAHEFDGSKYAPSLNIPTLLTYGTADEFTGTSATQYAAMMPNAKAEAVKGGHFFYYTDPIDFSKSIDKFVTS